MATEKRTKEAAADAEHIGDVVLNDLLRDTTEYKQRSP